MNLAQKKLVRYLLIVSMERERFITGAVFQSLIILLKNEYGFVDDVRLIDIKVEEILVKYSGVNKLPCCGCVF